MRSEEEAVVALIVLNRAYVVIGEGGELSLEVRGLVVSDFQGEPSPEVGWGLSDEPFDDGHSGRAAIESEHGVVLDLAGEARDFLRGDVREVGYQEIERAGDLGKKVALAEMDSCVEAQLASVFGSESERLRAQVDCVDFCFWELGGQGDGEDAAAGAHIDDASIGVAFSEDKLGQLLSFRAWNEGATVAPKGAPEKFDRAEKMLERFTRGTAFYQIPEGGEF
jgi:hypothetical protein